MRDFIKYLHYSLAAIVMISCQSEEKFNYFLQTKDGGNMKIGTTVSYLGIEVGEVVEVTFANVKNEDFVMATIQLTDKNILNKQSYITWSDYGALEIVNTQKATTLETGDTVYLEKKNIPANTSNTINPIITKEINQEEKELLSPEDQKKLDSLQAKINKLNNLIKEVNDQD